MKPTRLRSLPQAPWALCLALLLLATPSPASESSTDDRPLIGLVLGGGGARGAAHVGVLKVLEEQHVRVDYIAGTSMGSIVGALYALGLTADEIEQELLTVDWGELFDDRQPRRSRTMRRKEDDEKTFFPIELGLRRGKLATPRGLIAGQKFAFAFANPGLYTQGHASFDDLPIPYRAVATDLETGEKVVLDRGNLIRAVRSSMSIPGVFPPVEIDDRILVDGFLVSNVPVDAARDMGADIIIAVEVGRRLGGLTREDLNTLGGIETQAMRIQSQLALQDELSRADIVIRPELEEWNGTEYDQLARIIGPGEVAARGHLAELAALGVPDDEYAVWRREVGAHPGLIPVIDRIELANETRIDDAVILSRLDVPLGEPLDTVRLQASLEEVYELGLVESSDFDLVRRHDENVLRIYVHEKPYAPYLVAFGGAYRLNYSGLSRFLVHMRVNKLEVNRRGAEWRTDVSIGAQFGLATEFYQPLDFERRWFVSPYGLVTTQTDAFFLDGKQLLDYQYTRLLAGCELGRAIGRTFEVRAGVYGGNLRTDWSSGLLPVPKAIDGVAGLTARFMIDTLDDHRVPHRGLNAGVTFRSPQGWFDTDLEYDRLWGHFSLAAGTDNNSLLLDLQGGTSMGSGMPYFEDFHLGGLRTLSGYKVMHLRGAAFGVASIGWLHRIGGSDMPFASKYYLGVWADAGNIWLDSRDASFDDLLYNGAISLLLETALGPLHIGYGRSTVGDDAVHLDFGIHLGSPLN